LTQLKVEKFAAWLSITQEEELSMTKSRRHFSPPQKAEVVRLHVVGKEPVSNLADEFNVQPTQIQGWIKQVLDHAEQAFQKTGKRPDDGKDRKIAALEEKLVKKNEVVAELMEKSLGRSKRSLGSPRYPRRDRRLRGPLAGAHRIAVRKVRPLAGRRRQQILHLAAAAK
jgi:transposase-like protein